MSAISAPNALPPDLNGPHSTAPWRLPAVLWGLVAGAALQLQQPALWPAAWYGALFCAALALGGCAVAVGRSRHLRFASRRARVGVVAVTLMVAAAGALALFAVSGLRAVAYLEQALAPALEGQDIRVTGVVAAMPQANEAGTRLRLEVEAASLRGAPVRLPPQIDVTWYGGAFRDAGEPADLQRLPPPVRAGERWAMTVRLKAPHGLRNPHGFDYELWAWEQGVQATGYVRAGPRDEAPVRLTATWRHPVEQLRQTVRDAILDRLGRNADDSDPGRARIAGVVAALVTGDQRAIELAIDN